MWIWIGILVLLVLLMIFVLSRKKDKGIERIETFFRQMNGEEDD